MGFEMDGFNPEQVQTPQVVRGLPQQAEPGGTSAVHGSVNPQQQPLVGPGVGCLLAVAPEHQQLLFQEQILGNDRFDTARSKQSRYRLYQWRKQREMANGFIATERQRPLRLAASNAIVKPAEKRRKCGPIRIFEHYGV